MLCIVNIVQIISLYFVHVYKSVPIVIKRLTNVPEWCIMITESTRGAKKNTKSEETKMKNYDLSSIMRRAWEIYRTLTGDRIAKLSYAMKFAWAEAKAPADEILNGWNLTKLEEAGFSPHRRG